MIDELPRLEDELPRLEDELPRLEIVGFSAPNGAKRTPSYPFSRSGQRPAQGMTSTTRIGFLA